MNRSRRKNFNAIDAPSLARWIVLTLFVALTGLIYVYLSIQLHRLGDQQNKLEKQLATLRNQNEVATGQIAALTSRAALQRRMKEGYIKMIPIAEQNIVRLNAPARSAEEDAVQPVANEETRP
jgi:cell division protein FtsB